MFGYNSADSELILMKYEYIVAGWPWQILGAICAVATAGVPSEIFRFFSVSCRPYFTKFEQSTSIGVAMKTFRTEFLKIVP